MMCTVKYGVHRIKRRVTFRTFGLQTPSKITATFKKDAITKFRDAYARLAKKFPKIEIRYFYASQGNEEKQDVARALKLHLQQSTIIILKIFYAYQKEFWS